MNKKVLMGNIIGLILIVVIILLSFLIVSENKSKKINDKEEENIKQVKNIIKDSKNDKEFNYSKPEKQKDGTYKIDIINKKNNQSKAYYIVNLESNDYVIYTIGYTGKCSGETCENEQKNS